MLSFKQFLTENKYKDILPTGMIPGDNTYIHHGPLMVGNEYHPNIKELYKKYGSTGVYHYGSSDEAHGFVLGSEAESMHAGQKEQDPSELQKDLDEYPGAKKYLNREGL